MATVFTKIINGEFPGLFAWSDDQCAVFASIDPITEGHLLVVPRDEVVSFTQADEALFAHLATLPPASPSALVAPFAATPTTTSTPR